MDELLEELLQELLAELPEDLLVELVLVVLVVAGFLDFTPIESSHGYIINYPSDPQRVLDVNE